MNYYNAIFITSKIKNMVVDIYKRPFQPDHKINTDKNFPKQFDTSFHRDNTFFVPI
jgi:hypothetical protein